jgi:hypothetical protein
LSEEHNEPTVESVEQSIKITDVLMILWSLGELFPQMDTPGLQDDCRSLINRLDGNVDVKLVIGPPPIWDDEASAFVHCECETCERRRTNTLKAFGPRQRRDPR